MDENALARVELQRADLEANISKLRKSLRHWQTLEIDYEGLKEEFLGLPAGSSRPDIIAVGRDFRAELVDEKELQALLGNNQKSHRTPQQIVELLSKRVDYVSRNASTIQKQLSDAEKKRNALLLAEEPEFRDDAGLPLAEITEELDEAGNVLAGKVETPGSSVPQLVEVLKKAGVGDLVEQDGVVTTAPRSATEQKFDRSTLETEIGTSRIDNLSIEAAVATDSLSKPPNPALAFRSGTENTDPLQKTLLEAEVPRSEIEDITHNNTTSNKIAASTETADEELVVPSHPDDTEDEAALRREMLHYGLKEVGPIVAELDLEEDASDASYGDEDEDLSFDDDEDDDMYEDESEDDDGRTKGPVISERYHRKMKLLEKRLGIKDMQNLGPSPDLPRSVESELDKPTAAEAARKAAIAREEAALMESKQKEPSDLRSRPTRKAKKVAFADNIDIAPDSQSNSQPPSAAKPSTNAQDPAPVLDSIVERPTATFKVESTPPSETTQKKTSRFKATRASTPQTPLFPPPQEEHLSKPFEKAVPSGPPGTTVASTVVERPTSDGSSNISPPNADDIDNDLHRQEIAGEFYKLRNRMMHRQGGFVRDGAEANYGDDTASIPMEDEETGKIKKISRFKAARLR